MKSTSVEVIPHLGWFNAISFFFLHFKLKGMTEDLSYFLKNILSDNGLQNRKVKKIPSFETGWSFFAEGGKGGDVLASSITHVLLLSKYFVYIFSPGSLRCFIRCQT
jgi:hypothetical protein